MPKTSCGHQVPIADSAASGDELVPTRWTLIERLKNQADEKSWREFFNTYWKLIYNVAIKAGLTHMEAQEVVQETVISVCRKMAEFEANPARGKFKNWLLTLTQWRIIDQLRKRTAGHELRGRHAPGRNGDTSDRAIGDRMVDPVTNPLEAIWDAEWEGNVMEAALERLKQEVSPKQFQVFYLHVINKQPVSEVMKAVNTTATQVYLAKHRVGRLFRKAVAEVEKAGK